MRMRRPRSGTTLLDGPREGQVFTVQRLGSGFVLPLTESSPFPPGL
jgi:hypothetical protein